MIAAGRGVHEGAVLGTTHGEASRHEVTFGDHLVSGYVEVGEGVP